MSRQLGSLHHSNSHPANLQTRIPIIPFFAFPPPDFPIIKIPSSKNSDTNLQTPNHLRTTPTCRLRKTCRLRTISLYLYPDQLVNFFETPFSTHPIQSPTPIHFHSFLCFPSNPNLFSTSFRQII